MLDVNDSPVSDGTTTGAGGTTITGADTGTLTPDPRHDTRSRWGRSARIGGGTGRLLGVCIAIGMACAVAVGAAAYLLTLNASLEEALRWLAAGIMAFNGLVFGFIVAWVFLVDQPTIRGAAARPEESIEVRWYDKAAAGAFHDTLGIVGVGTFVLALGGFNASPSLVGLGVIVLMMASVALRYLIQKRRG